MDIDKLRYFCAIVQTGSMTKAAEILHISQPALSKAVKSLEEDFGDKLLVKVGRGLTPSPFGQRVADKASHLIDEIMNLPLLKEDLVEAPLRVATFEVFSTYFMGQTLSQKFADSKVSLLELVPGKIEEAILNNHTDIGITYLPVPNPNLDIKKVASIKMGIFGAGSNLKGKEVEDLDFVVPNIPLSGNPSKVKGLDGWPDHLFPRNIKYQVSMMESALDLCRRGLCVGYFPEFVIKIHNLSVKKIFGLQEISLPSKFKSKKQDVFLVKRKSDNKNSYYKSLASELSKL